MSKNALFLVFLLNYCFVFGQSKVSSIEIENLRKHALDNINEYETLLNELVLSNNPEEKRLLVEGSLRNIFDSTAKIEDDSDPQKAFSGFSEFIGYQDYLEKLPLLILKKDPQRPIIFSKILVSKLYVEDYEYIKIYFESSFKGVHKITLKPFVTIKRLATVKISREKNSLVTKIISVAFSSDSDLERIRFDLEEYNQELSRIQNDQKLRQIDVVNQYNKFIERGDSALSSSNYEFALEKYIQASELKPEDISCQNKISFTRALIKRSQEELLFRDFVLKGDLDYKKKDYLTSKKHFQEAKLLKPNDEYVNSILNKLEKRITITFPNKSTTYFALNYLINQTSLSPSPTFKTFSNNFSKTVRLENIEVSLYNRLGIYVSGIKTFKDIEPEFHYSKEVVGLAKNSIQNSGSNFSEMSFAKQGERLAGLNTGVYLSFFRPIYFKLGLSYLKGSRWNYYSGNYGRYLNFSAQNSYLYALDYEHIENLNFQVGLAIVVPAFQIEGTYDNYSKSIQLGAGINIPSRKAYLFRHNPLHLKHKSKLRSYKRFPYSSTTYLALSYEFLHTYKNDEKINSKNLQDSTFIGPFIPKFTFSFYNKFGFFISGFEKKKDPMPDYYYSQGEVNYYENLADVSGLNYQKLNFFRSQGNYSKVSAGVTFSFFRPIQFKLGATLIDGSMWNIYSGELEQFLTKFNNTKYYALDYSKGVTYDYVGGLAFVFPYFQFEFTYDHFYNKFSGSFGLNIPITY